MFVKTSNAFGDITIDNDAIAIVAGYNALDCYGVIDLVSRSTKESFGELFKWPESRRGFCANRRCSPQAPGPGPVRRRHSPDRRRGGQVRGG